MFYTFFLATAAHVLCHSSEGHTWKNHFDNLKREFFVHFSSFIVFVLFSQGERIINDFGIFEISCQVNFAVG